MKLNNIFLFLMAFSASLQGQTISEKKDSLSSYGGGGDLDKESEAFLQQVNKEISEDQAELKRLNDMAFILYERGATEAEFRSLLNKIRDLRANIAQLQNSWRAMAVDPSKSEPYGLWHQPDVTLEQLIIDYGAQDYVYVMSPDIAGMRLSVDSNLPIPRASWTEMLELILNQNGVGVKQLNPFLRQLYLVKKDKSGIKAITNNRLELEAFPGDTRIGFILTPDPSDVKRIWYFLDSFVNPESSVVQLIGRDILIISQVSEIKELLKMYDFIASNGGDKEYKAITLSRVDPDEMSKILKAIFEQNSSDGGIKAPKGEKISAMIAPAGPESNGLRIVNLGKIARSIFLVGTKEEVRKAEKIIHDIEEQVGGVRDKVIYWYTVRNSDPEEMAEILSRIYDLMIATGTGLEQQEKVEDLIGQTEANNLMPLNGQQRPWTARDAQEVQNVPFVLPDPALSLYPPDPYFQGGNLPVSLAPVLPANPNTRQVRSDRPNFIVDYKSNGIVMVVEKDILPKMKELMRKLDIPKKMVQLEVLLFEKRLNNRNNFGLNLLRLGTVASQQDISGIIFNEKDSAGVGTGIFDFILSRAGGAKAFDLIYRFLLTQDDITINSSPSVLTTNQTPAFIAIQEELSVNTGVFQVETAKGVTLQNAFQRAQYGITIKITPTIHTKDEDDCDAFDTITLDSDITFDTIETDVGDRPNVTRRNIKNEARIADGQTVILGGLRRKNSRDRKEAIPFLGEIPGVGKLFSQTQMRDDSTEMFIFITPKIVTDPACDLEWIKREEMLRRPGDVPEFLCVLTDALEREKNRLLIEWTQTLFGREPERCYSPDWHNEYPCPDVDANYLFYPEGEYDGR